MKSYRPTAAQYNNDNDDCVIFIFREKSWKTSKSECVFVKSSGY